MVDLSKLSQKQLKLRKIIANKYQKQIESEHAKIAKFVTKINDLLTTNPNLPNKTYKSMTIPELKEAKSVFSQIHMRQKGLSMESGTELKKIDEELVSRQP